MFFGVRSSSISFLHFRIPKKIAQLFWTVFASNSTLVTFCNFAPTLTFWSNIFSSQPRVHVPCDDTGVARGRSAQWAFTAPHAGWVSSMSHKEHGDLFFSEVQIGLLSLLSQESRGRSIWLIVSLMSVAHRKGFVCSSHWCDGVS